VSLSLGVDTGGTYTDAVLVNRTTKEIVSVAKSLTTRKNLFLGIFSAIDSCLKDISEKFSPREISIVCLSTTLATNAITEGYGSTICKLLIGYNEQLLRNQGFMEEMASDDIIWLAGGHDFQGDEVVPLDEETARKKILIRRSKVEAFAISGYFGIRNPDHELRVKALVEKLTDLPVTCAHELTSHLNSVNRAISAGHNARLIPLLKNLISNIDQALKQLNISAPLMIVKGDGAIVPAQWASERPIETILSGPAASSVGAYHLTGCKDVWVADMGGTTTDMALLINGRPAINTEGAYISHRRTMVEAVDIHTVGIGGDSLVEIDGQGDILLGPCRAIPLCLLANDYPGVLANLKRQVLETNWEKNAGQFVIPGRSQLNHLKPEERELLCHMEKEPLPLLAISRDRKKFVTKRRIEQLEKKCLLHRSAFTPTDALHVLGQMNLWNKEASLLGAELLANQVGMDVTKFCNALVKKLSDSLVKELLSKVMEDKTGFPQWAKEPTASSLLNYALNDQDDEEFSCIFKLKKPLVAIGAPVQAYMPAVASSLNTELIIPEYAHVANAFGAATAGIIQRGQAVIRMMEGGLTYRVHLPDRIADFPDFEAAKIYAEKYMRDYIVKSAKKAGAKEIKVEVTFSDHTAKLPAGWPQEIFLDTDLFVTAYGNPNMKNAVMEKEK
jgi:N-methylhydantoinase A/oxoprolinase/acetone carboxylase beta subunit